VESQLGASIPQAAKWIGSFSGVSDTIVNIREEMVDLNKHVPCHIFLIFYLFIYLFIHFILNDFMNLFIYVLVYLFIYLFIYLLIYLVSLFLNLFCRNQSSSIIDFGTDTEDTLEGLDLESLQSQGGTVRGKEGKEAIPEGQVAIETGQACEANTTVSLVEIRASISSNAPSSLVQSKEEEQVVVLGAQHEIVAENPHNARCTECVCVLF
jgi:hypothetical protein